MSKTENSTHDAHRPNVKLFVIIFGALLFLTLLTTAVSRLHLERPEAITIGLLIAAIKGSLVAAVFMHLWGENPIVHKILYSVAFFAAFLVTIPLVDAYLLLPQATNRVAIAAQHPDEGKGK